jgi:hypothetical protein
MPPLERNLKALHSLYPQAEGEVRRVAMDSIRGLPVWIRGAVEIFELPFLGMPSAPLYLVRPKGVLEFEHLARIYRELATKLSAPLLIVADEMPPKHRPLLVKFRIPFVYKDESIFAPDLGLKISRLGALRAEPKLEVKPTAEGLSPFAIKILAGLLTNQLPSEFNLKLLHAFLIKKRFTVSPAKLSPTLNELTQHGLLLAQGVGPRKKYLRASPQEAWAKALNLKLSPFFREVSSNYIPRKKSAYVMAGENALAHYSNLAEPKSATIAMTPGAYRAIYEKAKDTIPYGDFGKSSTVQIWKADPHLFSIEGVLNPVELFLAMRDHSDERIQIELDQLLAPYRLTRK